MRIHLEQALSSSTDSADIAVTFGLTALTAIAAARGEVDSPFLLLSESLSGGEEAAGERGGCDEANPSSCAVQRWLAPATAPLPGLGYPPIFIAAALDDARLLLELLDRGANASAIGPFAGVRPLHFAAEVDAASAASILCASGASANAAKSTGATPIHIAAQLGNVAVLRVLLSEECGGDPNLLLLGDTTPLHLAADAGETEAVAILLSAGAQKDFVMPLRGTSRSTFECAGVNDASFLLSVDPGLAPVGARLAVRQWSDCLACGSRTGPCRDCPSPPRRRRCPFTVDGRSDTPRHCAPAPATSDGPGAPRGGKSAIRSLCATARPVSRAGCSFDGLRQSRARHSRPVWTLPRPPVEI